MADKKIADAVGYVLPSESVVLQDLGFQGFEVADVETLMPIKKPRGRELTAFEKAVNRLISRSRVYVEHAISSVKRCRSVRDSLRLLRSEMSDMIMEIACGLHNLRLRLYPWQKVPMPGEPW
jgi:DDE superfamily endonuclease